MRYRWCNLYCIVCVVIGFVVTNVSRKLKKQQPSDCAQFCVHCRCNIIFPREEDLTHDRGSSGGSHSAICRRTSLEVTKINWYAYSLVSYYYSYYYFPSAHLVIYAKTHVNNGYHRCRCSADILHYNGIMSARYGTFPRYTRVREKKKFSVYEFLSQWNPYNSDRTAGQPIH
jgi:hypothetical protein